MFKGITRGIWILGLVSLFTDLSSEMLYPVMPLFLKSVGVSFIGIGLIEGMAEAIAGLSKIYFGRRLYPQLIECNYSFLSLRYKLSYFRPAF